MRTSADSSFVTTTALALALGAIISVQFGGALAATLIPLIGAPATVTFRLLLSSVLMMVLVRPSIKGHDPTAWRMVLGLGLTLGAMNFCFYQALARLPIGVAVTIEFLGPLLLGAAMSRRVRDAIAVAAALCGVVLISQALRAGWNELDHLGIACAATAGACWAAYILFQREVGKHFKGIDGITWALLLAAIVVTPLGIIDAHGPLTSPKVVGAGAGVALLSSALPYSMEMMALRTIPPRVFSVLLALEPAVAALAGVLVLHQFLTAWQMVGMGLVIAASIIVTWRGGRPGAHDTTG